MAELELVFSRDLHGLKLNELARKTLYGPHQSSLGPLAVWEGRGLEVLWAEAMKCERKKDDKQSRSSLIKPSSTPVLRAC